MRVFLWFLVLVAVFLGGLLVRDVVVPAGNTAVASVAIATDATAVLPASDPSPTTPNFSHWTLEEKIGQLFIIGHWNTTSPEITTTLLRDLHLGGIIIMQAPNDDILELRTWTDTWHDTTNTPPLIAIDQEGGVVNRIQHDAFSQTAQTEIADSKFALETGQTRGEELAFLGINTNFAPVLEASVNPNAFLYDRVFREPSTISRLSGAMIVGMREHGVIAVPKHYPGHLDTPADSHEELPVITFSTTTFAEHTTAFTEVIAKTKPNAIMTAHVLVPSVDARYPATLSNRIITGELRSKIGFGGVVITDDITMKAITNSFTPEEASYRAIAAGADMILFAAEPEKAADAIDHLIEKVHSGSLSESRIDESLKRILEMKVLYQ